LLKRKTGELDLTRPLAIRLIHWLLAFTVFFTFFIFYDGDWIHRYLGYLSLLALAFRLLYLLKRKEKHKALSNYPRLANTTYLFIWLTVFAVGLTGWMMTLDRFWGEDWVENLHLRLSQGLIGLVALHLLGVFFDAYKKRRPTWMFIIR
jgi:cytochrome b